MTKEAEKRGAFFIVVNGVALHRPCELKNW
jgi:hypothetical protein